MNFNNLLRVYAEAYVDQHEYEIVQAVFEALDSVVDVDDVAMEVADLLAANDRSAAEMIAQEIMRRL